VDVVDATLKYEEEVSNLTGASVIEKLVRVA
jgi:hypothetical protein